MSNRSWLPKLGALEVDMVEVYGRLIIGASGAVSSVTGKGIKSVVRNSAGNYTVNLTDSYDSIMWASATLVDTENYGGTVGTEIRVSAYDTVKAIGATTDPSVTFQATRADGAAADPHDGALILLRMDFRNSSVDTPSYRLWPAASTSTYINTLLGQYVRYGSIGGSALTNTGSTVIDGDIGSYPTNSITGFPPGTFTGTNHGNDSDSQAAKSASDAARVTLQALGGAVDISATDLGGATLTPGVYAAAAATTWTAGPLTLNAGGNPNATFVIRAGTTIITPSAASVILTGGARAGNVMFVAGSSATFGTSTVFQGQMFAAVSITATTSSTFNGRLFAGSGAVTLDTNTITPV